MFKLPILSPRQPIITQRYGEIGNVQWYHDHGINIPFHNGVDFITGTNTQTYGTPLVCPFPEGGTITDIIYDSAMSTKGNGVYLTSKLIDGCQFRIILWHTGEIKVKKGDTVSEGDIVCYIGNSGLCSPAPTTDQPYNGSHLHLGCYKIVNGSYVYDTNHTVLGECDPLIYFDRTQWYIGPDSGAQHDIEPLKWRWSKLGITDWWQKTLDAWKFWK